MGSHTPSSDRIVLKTPSTDRIVLQTHVLTCVCKTILSVKHTLLECSVTTVIKNKNKNGYDINACNNVRDILYNTDIMNFVVELIVHSPVGKLVYLYLS